MCAGAPLGSLLLKSLESPIVHGMRFLRAIMFLAKVISFASYYWIALKREMWVGEGSADDTSWLCSWAFSVSGCMPGWVSPGA